MWINEPKYAQTIGILYILIQACEIGKKIWTCRHVWTRTTVHLHSFMSCWLEFTFDNCNQEYLSLFENEVDPFIFQSGRLSNISLSEAVVHCGWAQCKQMRIKLWLSVWSSLTSLTVLTFSLTLTGFFHLIKMTSIS